MSKEKTLEDYKREESEKKLKMQRRNIHRSLMILKAEAKNITVTEAEVDLYLQTHK